MLTIRAPCLAVVPTRLLLECSYRITLNSYGGQYRKSETVHRGSLDLSRRPELSAVCCSNDHVSDRSSTVISNLTRIPRAKVCGTSFLLPFWVRCADLVGVMVQVRLLTKHSTKV